MSSPVESNQNLVFADHDVGGQVDEVTEDLAGLSVSVSPHLGGEQTIQAAGNHQQGHVEVDLEPHGGGKSVHVEEAHRVGEGVLDQHALGVAGDELGDGFLVVIGEQNCRFFVSEIAQVELAERSAGQYDRLVVDAGRAELA